MIVYYLDNDRQRKTVHRGTWADCRRFVEDNEANYGASLEIDNERDLAGRPVLAGGTKGTQGQFLNIEDFKTNKERERVNSLNDIPNQLRLF